VIREGDKAAPVARNIAVFMGTRPEAPVVAALRGASDFRCTVVAMGQLKEMFRQVADTFGFRIDADLEVMRPNRTAVWSTRCQSRLLRAKRDLPPVGVLKPCCVTAGIHTRPLTDVSPIKPSSICCFCAREPNPGRGSTYRRGNLPRQAESHRSPHTLKNENNAANFIYSLC
jgi:hypothetical protein